MVVFFYHLVFSYNKDLSLSKMYEQAVREEGGIPNLENLGQIVDTSDKYIEALKLKTINKTIKDLEEHLDKEEVITPVSIESSLKETFKNVSSQVERIVDSETQVAKGIGALEGIIKSNASLGIDDPVVFFVVMRRR